MSSAILQWNVAGLVSKWGEARNFFSVLAPIIIALQETWFFPTDPYNFQLHNYTLYCFDQVGGERRHGGVALYISNDFSHSQIAINTTLQAVAWTIHINGRNIDICSIYIPPNYDNNGLLQQMNDLVRQFTHPYLLLGDFNAHSPDWWTSQLLDGRGRQVEDFLSAHNLVTLTNNQPTHFITPNRQSISLFAHRSSAHGSIGVSTATFIAATITQSPSQQHLTTRAQHRLCPAGT